MSDKEKWEIENQEIRQRLINELGFVPKEITVISSFNYDIAITIRNLTECDSDLIKRISEITESFDKYYNVKRWEIWVNNNLITLKLWC